MAAEMWALRGKNGKAEEANWGSDAIVRDVACIDLFCGAGGLTHGLISEGLNVVAGVDVDDACRHPFETNNSANFILKDVSRLLAWRLIV